ncbi:uncharacterized protein isoform X3 [Rhodnius prolixus]|uniref:uncharacterized protein isoform X3 n=1 Tax=Rhodnius prolixus TaxID=13249 RepID=UPI003D18A905
MPYMSPRTWSPPRSCPVCWEPVVPLMYCLKRKRWGLGVDGESGRDRESQKGGSGLVCKSSKLST